MQPQLKSKWRIEDNKSILKHTWTLKAMNKAKRPALEEIILSKDSNEDNVMLKTRKADRAVDQKKD